MNGRDNRDDHLFLWCAFLILVFVVLPALYIAHADSVNRPLLALAKAQIQVFTPFFDKSSTTPARGFAGLLRCCSFCSAWPPSSWGAWVVLSAASIWKVCSGTTRSPSLACGLW